MLGFGESSKETVEEPVVPQEAVVPTATEAPVESVAPTEEGVSEAPVVSTADETVEVEAVDYSIEEEIDAIFEDLQALVHGSSDEMKAQQGDLLNAKVKIKRLLA